MSKSLYGILLLLTASLRISSMERDKKVTKKITLQWPLEHAQRSHLLSQYIVYENDQPITALPVTLPKMPWATRETADTVHKIVTIWPELPIIYDCQKLQHKIATTQETIDSTNVVYNREEKRLESKIALLELRKQKVPQQKQNRIKANRLARELEKLENDNDNDESTIEKKRLQLARVREETSLEGNTENELLFCITKEQNNLLRVTQKKNIEIKELEQNLAQLTQAHNPEIPKPTTERAEKISKTIDPLSFTQIIKAIILTDFLGINAKVTQHLRQSLCGKKVTKEDLQQSNKLSLRADYIRTIARRPQLFDTYSIANRHITWAPDGQRIALAKGRSKKIILWNPRTNKKIYVLRHTNPIEHIEWNPTQEILAVSEADPMTITLWNTYTGTKKESFKEYWGAYLFKWSPNGNHLAVASPDVLSIWRVEKDKPAHKLFDIRNSAGGCAWNPNEQEVAGADNSTIAIYNLKTRALTYSLYSDYFLSFLRWSPDGTKIASMNTKHQIELWDVATKQKIYTSDSQKATFMWGPSVVWSPNGEYIATSEAHVCKVWQVGNDNPVYTLEGHGLINGLRWNFDGSFLAAATSSEGFSVWDAKDGQLLYTTETGGEIKSVVWSPTQSLFALRGKQKVTKLFAMPNDFDANIIKNYKTLVAFILKQQG